MQKLFSFFSTKSISVFGYKAVKHLSSWPLNELVKLTMLCTTGPWNAKKQTQNVVSLCKNGVKNIEV